MSERNRQLILVVVLPLVTLGLIVGPVLADWGRLPDRLATGWGREGVADRSSSPAAFLALQGAAAAVGSILFLVAGLRPGKPSIHRATAAVIAAAIVPTFAVVSVFTVRANTGVANWTDVASPSWWWMVAAIGCSLAAVAAVGWLVRDLFVTPTPPLDTQPSAGLSVGRSQAAAWHSGASSRWPFVAAVPLGLAGVALVAGGLSGMADSLRLDGGPGLVLGLTLLLIAAAALAFATIGVSVDRRGLTVSYGPLPWPRTRVGLDQIESAHVIDVKPIEHGGWGYRGSRKLFGKAAVVVRGGEGIRLGLKNGKEFVVTVDHAAQGAGVLNDLRSAMA